MPRAISQLKKLKVKQRQKVLKHRFFQKFVHHQKESIFSKQLKLKKLSNRIENRLDTIEELLDSIEDNNVNVESFRIKLGKVWDELENLKESL